MFYKAINKLCARYKYGLTATPYRNAKGTEKAMFCLLGNTIAEVDKSVIQDKITPATVIKVKTNFDKIPENCLETDGTMKYSQLTTALSQGIQRNNLILKILKKRKNHSILVLGDRVAQLKELQKQLSYGVIVDGSMISKSDKALREKRIEDMRQGKEKVLFATFGLAKERIGYPKIRYTYSSKPTPR